IPVCVARRIRLHDDHRCTRQCDGRASLGRPGVTRHREHREPPGARDGRVHRQAEGTQADGPPLMLYIAYVKARAGAADSSEIEARSRKWWNEGTRPEGLKTVGIGGCLGTESP